MIDKSTGSKGSAGSTEQSQIDAVKQRIRKMLSELKLLAKSTEITDKQFLSQLVNRTIESTGAAGATIWEVSDDGQVSVVHEAGTTATNGNLDEEQLTMHERLVRTVVSSARPMLIEPDARDQKSGEVINPMAYLLLLKPLNDPSLHRHYVIELFQRPDIAPAARTGYMRYLEEIGEIFGSWQARHQLRFQSSQQTRSSQTMDFVRAIHASLDADKVAYAAANDGRLLVGCDRLSVLGFDGRNSKVLSVSGQDDFDNRSNVVCMQQEIATMVCRTKQPIWLIGESDELPRATRDLVDDYLNEAHSRTLGVIPLFDGKDADVDEDVETEEAEPVIATGALILEWFNQDVTKQQAAEDVEVLADHIGRSMANAGEYKSIFLMPVWRAIGKWRWLVSARTLPKTILAGIAALVLLLFFCFFPWSFDMRVQGALEPIDKQNVYAITSGVVSKVHVEYGQEVKKDELLVELHSDELNYEMTQIQGELDITKRRLESARNALLIARENGDLEPVAQLQAEINNQDQRLQSLRQQEAALRLRQKRLEIRSPIDGIIVSSDPVRQLTERPVSPQDVVLVVAATDSAWQMELFVPERKYGHILKAGNKAGELPDVTFFSATDPNKRYSGKVTLLESHASEHPVHGNTVRALADFHDDHPQLYVGAAITAKIHCGRTSVGYAWFHELFEFVQAKVFF